MQRLTYIKTQHIPRLGQHDNLMDECDFTAPPTAQQLAEGRGDDGVRAITSDRWQSRHERRIAVLEKVMARKCPPNYGLPKPERGRFCQPVRWVETNRTFPSITDAARALGVSRYIVCTVVHGRTWPILKGITLARAA